MFIKRVGISRGHSQKLNGKLFGKCFFKLFGLLL